MKKIYTSNFAHYKKVPCPISIARKSPPWFKGAEFLLLAPSYKLVMAYKSGEISSKVYTKRYFKELEGNGVTVKTLLKALPKESTLLCWEKAGEFCHRRLVAEWIEKETGIKVEEYHE